ncbi:hypothetical protein,glimmer [Sulfolobus islandicus M.14.25]|uniref:Uncharacterized protein n=3 Tax=Saccharolobus islandicus TaxID=43080 RepID=C4KJQ1_SACI6|nr:hypothetical protein,glimmer [Sulfolobus islandicus M.14.25]ACR42696.1 hypothetical protein M164_2844 [Sulfolobus islandicus M.16.4]ADX83379.1 conserved hypothetical protein [Sulfolobus islandicus HVE10/4]
MHAFTAFALGITLKPLLSRSTSASVLIASISAIIASGFSLFTTALTAFGFIISITYFLCATCIAGAKSYLSTAITSNPILCASIAISFPNSPLPSRRIFFEPSNKGVPISIYQLLNSR